MCGLQNRNARFDSWVPRPSQAPDFRGFWLCGADRGIMCRIVACSHPQLRFAMSTAAPSRGGASHAPDSLRLGGLDWARRTEGRLSSRERGRLLAAVAIGQWENALGRAKLAPGPLPARAVNVDLDTFSVPDSPFAREAERACDELPAALVSHSYRTWLFGRALAAVDGIALDLELFY